MTSLYHFIVISQNDAHIWPYFVINFNVDYNGWDEFNNLCNAFVLEALGKINAERYKNMVFCCLLCSEKY